MVGDILQLQDMLTIFLYRLLCQYGIGRRLGLVVKFMLLKMEHLHTTAYTQNFWRYYGMLIF